MIEKVAPNEAYGGLKHSDGGPNTPHGPYVGITLATLSNMGDFGAFLTHLRAEIHQKCSVLAVTSKLLGDMATSPC